MSTRIGASTEIRGDLFCGSAVVVEGRLTGELRAAGDVQVLDGADVHAQVQGARVRVEGRVVGDVSGTERIELSDAAEVTGDLRAPRIQLADGARFSGSVDMNG